MNDAAYLTAIIARRNLNGRDATPIVQPALTGGYVARARMGKRGDWADGPARATQELALLALCELLDLRPQRRTGKRECPLFDTDGGRIDQTTLFRSV